MEGRRFKQGINTGISIVIFLGILVIINLISNRHYKRFDLTEAKIYTLSDQSKKILKSLKENLFLYGFFKEESEMKPKVTRLFEEYKTSSKYVKYKFIDPDKNPLMAKQYDVRSYDTIVVEYKGKREKVYIPEEKYITKAILKLIKSGKKKVYFTKGHGEKSIEEYGIGGISSLKERLEDEQYQVKEVFLMKTDSEGLLTGIGDNEQQIKTTEAILYPNPARDIINVEFSMLYQKATFSLTDISGKTAIVKQLTANRQTADISAIPTGTYVYRIFSNDGLDERGKILVE